MQVLIVGANGYLAKAIAVSQRTRGAVVSGLVRNPDHVAELIGIGVDPVVGDAYDYEAVIAAAHAADVVIWTANLPFVDELPAITPVLTRFYDSGKTFIFTSGTAVLSIDTPMGQWRQESFAEDDSWSPIKRMVARVRTEDHVRAAGGPGLRTMVIRPPLIWGHGASNQIPAIFESVEKTGAACYVGAGLNCYSNVHVDDLAEVFALAIDRGVSGALYHAVAGEVSFGILAEAVAEVMRCPTRSVTLDQAVGIWGERRAPMYFGASSRSRSPRTIEELGWTPMHLDLRADIRSGSYRDRFRP